MSDIQRLVSKRLPLLSRQPVRGPRDGTQSGPMAQQISDLYWRCGVELAKVIYTQIDARYPFSIRNRDSAVAKAHYERMNEARKILNESRNEVLEAILPMFMIVNRTKNDNTQSEADEHAHDYIVCNAFDVMAKTFVAWTPHFVDEDNVESLQRVIENIAAIQRGRLEGLLANFAFAFRPIGLPAQEKK